MSINPEELPEGLVCVRWVDSHYRPGWTTEEPVSKPLACTSVGWIVAQDETGITLASHVTDEQEPQRCGEMTIPRQAVVGLTPISASGSEPGSGRRRRLSWRFWMILDHATPWKLRTRPFFRFSRFPQLITSFFNNNCGFQRAEREIPSQNP